MHSCSVSCFPVSLFYFVWNTIDIAGGEDLEGGNEILIQQQLGKKLMNVVMPCQNNLLRMAGG